MSPTRPTLLASLQPWLDGCAQTWRSGGGRQTKAASLGEAWAFGLVVYSQENLVLGPNAKTPNCNTNGSGTLESPGIFGLSSNHPGGANVLVLDGSVRFLKDGIDNRTTWALGSVGQGEVISADAL